MLVVKEMTIFGNIHNLFYILVPAKDGFLDTAGVAKMDTAAGSMLFTFMCLTSMGSLLLLYIQSCDFVSVHQGLGKISIR